MNEFVLEDFNKMEFKDRCAYSDIALSCSTVSILVIVDNSMMILGFLITSKIIPF